MVAEHIITAGRNATDLHLERQEKSLARSNDVRCVEEILTRDVQDGIIHNTAERDINSVGHIMEITIKGQKMINFGSCGYLGLENHPSLIEGAKRAVEKYGTQFTMSRAYSAIDLYDRLESLLGKIYSKPVLATPSTTLGHMSALPVLVGDNDAVILDRQVHASVQTTAQLLKARGVPLNIIPHNDMDSLEKKLIDLKSKHEKIWYFADGVYSMYGDCAPFSDLVDLLNRHKNFNLYVDDAHGVGWAGKHGSGVARSHMTHHERLIMTISLCKSFASAGGAIVFATQAQKDLVRKCGGTMIFSGPIQPPMLGAACASAEFHLSSELEGRQSKLRFLVKYCNEGLQRYNLPQIHINDSPIFFIPVGKQEIANEIIKRLMKDGYFVNKAGYPAVPLNMAGFRFTMTYHFSSDDVENFLSCVQRNYKAVLAENGLNEVQVSKTFGIAPFQLFSGSKREKHDTITRTKEMSSSHIEVDILSSISEVKCKEWNSMFYGKGNIDSDSLRGLESTFSPSSPNRENRWELFYYIARDVESKKVIAATHFTRVLCKDDMLASKHQSERIEKMRKADPYFMCSEVLMTGSMASLGDHLYLDQNSPYWEESLHFLADAMEQNKGNANSILIHSIPSHARSNALDESMLSKGFNLIELPTSYRIDSLEQTELDYVKSLCSRDRQNLQKFVLNHIKGFRIEHGRPLSNAELLHCYGLYKKVFERSTELATFILPFEYFRCLASLDYTDFIRVYKGEETEPISMIISHHQNDNYATQVIGFERVSAGQSMNLYLLTLYSALVRAMELNCSTVDLGMTTGTQKKRLRSTIQSNCGYMQKL